MDIFLLQQLGPRQLWRFLPIGYLVTIAIETPILFFGLSARHSRRRRLLAGVWLTACTYPVVTLVLPLIMANYSRAVYLLVSEVFAPVAECSLFWLAFGSGGNTGRRTIWRDFAVIIAANLASFAVGEVLNALEWFGLY